MDSRCLLCFGRLEHVCLWCNFRAEDEAVVMAHQEKKQHFGGHLIKNLPSGRRRAAPARYRNDSEVDNSVSRRDAHNRGADQQPIQLDNEMEGEGSVDAGDDAVDADSETPWDDKTHGDDETLDETLDPPADEIFVDFNETESLAVIAAEEACSEKSEARSDVDQRSAFGTSDGSEVYPRSEPSEGEAADTPSSFTDMSDRNRSNQYGMLRNFKRKRQQKWTATGTSTNSEQSSDQSVLLWVSKVRKQYPDIESFHNDQCFSPSCSPGKPLRTGKSSSNCYKRKLKRRSVKRRRVKVEAPSLSQETLDKLIRDCIIENNISFATLENEKFKQLVLSGRGRSGLKMMSRRELGRQLAQEMERMKIVLWESVSKATSRLSITLNLWSDKASRPFLAVTGHYFDSHYKLKAPLLAMAWIPKGVMGHTSTRIAECVQNSLRSLLGEDFRDFLYCCTTDGASNVKAAAKLLGSERPCLQHSLQLLLKWFCVTNRTLASAISACNYLAKFSELSCKFREAVGKIPTGVVTRWNSYISSAEAVLGLSDKIRNFVTSSTSDSSMTEAMTSQTMFLNSYGYAALQDMVTLLKPLMQITIDEEAELYITSSSVIPRLRLAKEYIDTIFEVANGASIENGPRLVDRESVKGWQTVFNQLWLRYLEPFLHDPLLQAATLVDVRNADSFKTMEQFQLCRASLATFLQHQQRLLEASVRGGEAVDKQTSFFDQFVDSLPNHDRRILVDPMEEVDRFLKILSAKRHLFDMESDPVDFFKLEEMQDLKLLTSVALDILAVPAGEAPSERIFSVASRIIGTSHVSMTPAAVCETTYLRKNRKVYADEPASVKSRNTGAHFECFYS